VVGFEITTRKRSSREKSRQNAVVVWRGGIINIVVPAIADEWQRR
jgi:hypothetical protein